MLSLRASVELSPMIWTQSGESLASQSMSSVLKTKEDRQESHPRQGETTEQATAEKVAFSHSPQRTPELSDSEFSMHSPRSSGRFGEGSQADRRDSLVIPIEQQYRIKDTPPQYERSRQPSNASANLRHSPDAIPLSPYLNYRKHSSRSQDLPPRSPVMLPLPTLNLESGAFNTSQEDYDSLASPRSQTTHIHTPSNVSATISQQELFRRQLFTNAAVLCEV